ncbi:MAG: radical SAM protein [Candidatus Latescibacteria bacterium]|nr:radical SAM protein [Candidatus Latescibacterota bacterium]NIM21417.1 radical SAM protein [Candidatus Latescibacterota bacterium]NIM65598.1 radical SAM protein [Candidatus Latescibacterota bacterium]NIO01978.1 radical SAM protein [Candidatus Latescibacterota bacterium]NIO28790.1 radical SAM protein [Candidatus Latescibacterota bacterium]
MKRDKSILLVMPSRHARETLCAQEFARFQPLGLAYIAASTPGHWNLEILDESFENIGELERFAIVGVSIATRSALRAYQIAEEAKSHGCYTVAGGIHASMRVEETLSYFDTVVSGEGEESWQRFLKDYEAGAPKRLYEASEHQSMDEIFAPRRSSMSDFYQVGSIQTSRGCPFNCSFCSVTVFSGRRYRYRSPDLVLEELLSIPQKYLFFVDDNLVGCSERSIDRAKKIFKGMIERKLGKKYIAQVTINFGFDDELIELASESGCGAVFIGIESIDENILKSMNKMINVKTGVSRYRGLFRRIQEKGIAVVGTMALGSDGESPTIFEDTARFIDSSGMDAVQLTIATPLPGTRLFEQLTMEGRIVFNNYPEDWIHYSLGSLVFKPRDKNPADIAAGWKRLVDSAYSKPKLLKRDIQTFIRTKKFSSVYLSHRLNKAYREAYLGSSFYKHPSLDAFARQSEPSSKTPDSIGALAE